MTTVFLGVFMFTFVIVSLVVLLMLARRRLVATGNVSIIVNDDVSKALTTLAGGTLLGTLSENKIFIPSACGGKGSCGVCKVNVTEGGGALLPTEAGHVNRGEAREGCRLSCQVKVKGDMKIELPPEVFSVRKWTCKVRSNHNVATFIKELVLELPEGEAVPFKAGGYIQIEAPPHVANYKDFEIEDEYREDWDKFDMWRSRGPTPWPATRRREASSCSTSGSPRLRRGRRRERLPGRCRRSSST
jgi:Na+-transporting NADH:ubiquinone oxidoreductase subunit F